MTLSTTTKTMVYCPKCNATYEDGTQRFCLNDGGRLLPAPSSIRAAANSQGVFASVLRSSPENDGVQNAPRVFTAEPVQNERNSFHTNFSSKVFSEEKIAPPVVEEPSAPPQSAVRRVKQSEVASGTANVGNRKTNPIGRTALTKENPQVLIGQTIKGRYQITDTLGQEDSSITYLAEDKINPGKEMIVRVLMDEETDDFLSRIFAEERVSLSHINHPNVASVLDSGELLEGNPFVVTEMVDGFSVKEKLEILEKFEPVRAAKIIREASYALSEVHQNGVLHRNLKPDNIFLTINDSAKEQVKVTDFAVSGNIDKRSAENVKYLSPEQLEGRLPNYAGDIYSLAVIAYEMLTGRHPFPVATADKLLKAQKKGLVAKISDAPDNLPLAASDALEKALAFEPSERYSKARDFGDALFQALTSAPVKTAEETKIKESIPMPTSLLLFPPQTDDALITRESRLRDENKLKNNAPIIVKSENPAIENSGEQAIAKPDSSNLAWTKRSPEPVNEGNSSRLWLAGIGILAILLAGWAIWNYALNNPPTPELNAAKNSASAQPNTVLPDANTTEKSSPTPEEVESPPLSRTVSQPPDTEYFQNSNAALKGELSRNYRGFTLYYPKSWQKNSGATNFLDVSRNAESGTPIEQFLVSYYNSRGTLKLDSERFPRLVQDSSKTLSKIVSNYRLVSEGETTVNNGWKGYEMKFEGAGVTANGEKINLWGKRLFIPAARPGAKSGFVITMLATSLAPDVKSADDVGTKDELAKILETFEPAASE